LSESRKVFYVCVCARNLISTAKLDLRLVIATFHLIRIYTIMVLIL